MSPVQKDFFNQKIFVNLKHRIWILIFLLNCFIFFSACGKRRPPVPPSARLPQTEINKLSAAQQGNQIILKVIPPTKTVKRISIYRLNELQNSPLTLPADEFAARATLIGTTDRLNSDDPQSAYYSDPLSVSEAASRLRYAVRFVYDDGRRSELSSFLIVEPNFQTANPPRLSPVTVEQTAIRLEWQKPFSNLDQSKPANVSGYRVYRRIANLESDSRELPTAPELLNQNLITETSFADTTFKFKTNYQYFVRAVTLSANETIIESLNSNYQVVTPLDVFPPAAPIGVTIGAAPNRFSLFFAANSEPDIAGYLVFRTENEKTPLSEWRRLTEQLLTASTFEDESIVSGQKYYYYLQAVDNDGNLSLPSQVVGETAP